MRGAGESLCGMPMCFTNIEGAAAFFRPDMPHTLHSPAGGVEAATAPPFMATQGLVYATGTRALSPRDPEFPSFLCEKKENKKSESLAGNEQYRFYSCLRLSLNQLVCKRPFARTLKRSRRVSVCTRLLRAGRPRARRGRARQSFLPVKKDAECTRALRPRVKRSPQLCG